MNHIRHFVSGAGFTDVIDPRKFLNRLKVEITNTGPASKLHVPAHAVEQKFEFPIMDDTFKEFTYKQLKKFLDPIPLDASFIAKNYDEYTGFFIDKIDETFKGYTLTIINHEDDYFIVDQDTFRIYLQNVDNFERRCTVISVDKPNIVRLRVGTTFDLRGELLSRTKII